MKQLLLLTIAFATFNITKAQISKGSTFIGGNVNFSSSNTDLYNNDKSSQSYIGITPQLGTAVKENLILGVQLSYSHENIKNTYSNSESKFETNAYGGGLFLRKYFPIVNRVYLFGEAALNAQSFKSKNDQTTYPVERKGWNLGLSLKPGISFAVVKSFYLNLSVNNLASIVYAKSEETNFNQTTKSSSFSFSSNIQNNAPFAFGFNFILPKK